MSGWVYIMTNRPRGVLYVGVTSDLVRRISEHREGSEEGFSSRYRLKCLVLAEEHPTIAYAIRRGKNLKRWSRQWKIDLVESVNPDWRDLWQDIGP
jgi:putative endonuclease